MKIPIDPEAVRKQLERILASPGFHASARLKRFLRFVVEETLGDDADRIKAFSIAFAVFDRGESFDPQTDTIVRVEARRLRRKLEEYYESHGRDDPIVITMPRGSYVASFRLNTLLRARLASDAAHNDPSGFSTAASIPVVAILPLKAVGSGSLAHALADGFTEDIVTDASRIPGLQVISHRSSAAFAERHIDPARASVALGATHLLMGSFQIEGTQARIHARLIDAKSSYQLWAKRFDCALDHILSTQREIAREVGIALSATFEHSKTPLSVMGGIRSSEARTLCRQAENLYNPPTDLARIAVTEQLYQRAIEIEPEWAVGYAGLAYVRGIGAWFNPEPISEAYLAKSDALSDKALNLEPLESRAFVAKTINSMLRDDYECAARSSRDAVTVEPSSSLAHAWQGLMMTYTGRAIDGIGPLQTAIRLNPADPRAPYLNMLGATYFHCGEHEKAEEALNLNIVQSGECGPHMLAYIAANHYCLGQRHEASEALKELRETELGFSVETWLCRAFQNRADAENLLATLENIDPLSA